MHAPTLTRRSNSGVRIEIGTGHHKIEAQTFAFLLSQIVTSLRDVDRNAFPRKIPQLNWAIDDLSINGSIKAIIVPSSVSRNRPIGTLEVPANGLIEGIRRLEDTAEIPPLFSYSTVTRVQHIGSRLERETLPPIRISVAESDIVAVVNSDTAQNARRAVQPTSRSFGSITGRLDVLSARSSRGLRAQILDERTRRAVVVRAAEDQRMLLRDAWGNRVIAGGCLLRNRYGQAVSLELTELEVLQERSKVSARDILGIAPRWTGDLTTQEFVRQARRG